MKNKLLKLKDLIASGKKVEPVLTGFDGFIDEIIHVVDKRLSPNHFKKIDTITAFSDRIRNAAGLSANVELVPQQTKIGGNGVIMAKCLHEAGLDVNYCGALGKQKINTLFQNFADECCKCISVAEPGYTQALEFDDGKIMLGKPVSMNDVTWENIINSYSNFSQLICKCSMIAFTNWTMINSMNEIIFKITDILRSAGKAPLLFFDLADPSKRPEEDVLEIFALLSKLNSNFPVILGLNESESKLADQYLEINCADISSRAEKIRASLNINTVVIHPINGAAAANKTEAVWVDGPYTATPKLTTGAGDNFNAGFCLGNLLGMPLEYALLCGVYTSGYYVRFAKSPKRNDLIHWLDKLASEMD